MTTRVTCFGQATLAIEASDTGITLDPWFSGPAHLDAWAPYPRYSDVAMAQIRETLDRLPYVGISHDHEDHFDPAFLKTLAPKTLLVGAFRKRSFHRALKALSPQHTVRVLQPGERFELGGGTSVEVVVDQPAYRTDSCFVVRTPGGTVLHANDCPLDLAYLEHLRSEGPVGLFFYTLNFLANGYPFPYLDPLAPETSARVASTRDSVLASFERAVATLRPQLACAFAGPVWFQDELNAFLNDHPDARNWQPMVDSLVARGHDVAWPAPGSSFTLRPGEPPAASLAPWPAATPPPSYVERAPEPVGPLPLAHAQAFAEHLGGTLRELGRSLETHLVLCAAESVAELAADARAWAIDVDLSDPVRPVARELHGELPEPHLALHSTGPLLTALLTHEITIDDLLLSCCARMHRAPDRFDSLLHSLLRYSGDPGTRAALVESLKREAPSTLAVEHEGTTYHVPRFCPHEWASLEEAQVADGCLTCPRHGWTFELEGGACVKGDPDTNLYQALKTSPK